MFDIDGLIIDRVLDGVLRTPLGADVTKPRKVYAHLNEVQNLSINQSAETKDKTSATGTLMRRFFTAKSVEVSAENAIVSLSLMGLQTGSGKIVASEDAEVQLPRIIKIPGTEATYELPDEPVEGTLTVTGMENGIAVESLAYKAGVAAGEGTYAISGKTLSLPTDAVANVQVVYEYTTENAVQVVSKDGKYPSVYELILSVLVCDPCDKEILRHAYISFPSFQMAPDFDWTVDTESAHPFSGAATVAYCSDDKQLFYISVSKDDIEEEEDPEVSA